MKKKLLFLAAVLLCCGSMMAQPRSASAPELFIKAPQSLMAPVWSPDGSMIAVTGDNYIGIYVAQADGSGLEQVSTALGAGYQMSWTDVNTIQSSPYTMVNDRRMTRVEATNVVTGETVEVAAAKRDFKRSRAINAAPSVLQIMVDEPLHAAEMIASLNEYSGKMVINPALSPDGTKIAFQIAGKGLFVCNADGSGVKALGKGSHASWLPDSKNVMVARLQDNGERFTEGDIYCVNTVNGNAVNMTPDTDVIPVTLAVSPDGSKVAFDNDTDGCIYLINLNY